MRMGIKQQRGGTLVGFIMGLVVGMAIALGVAVYVTKVPIPFMTKGPIRAPDQDAAEAQKNKDWDPNAPLYGKKGAKAADKADEAKPETKTEAKPESSAPSRKPDAATGIDPKSADPLGDLAKAKAAEPKSDARVQADTKPSAPKPDSADPFIYFVQAGAFRSPDEAEAQRAKTTMLGLESKVSERDQGGRTIYRVRIGPIDKAQAEQVRTKLEAAKIDSALVRVQR